MERKAVVKIIETYRLCEQFKIFNWHPLWILFSQADKICFDIFLQSPYHNLQKSNFNKSISYRMTDLFQFVSEYLRYNLCTEHCLHIKQLYKR